MRELQFAVLGIITGLAILVWVGSAHAADPRCVWDNPVADPDNPPAPPADVIDAQSGSFDYCVPQVDSFGNAYPLTGYPMVCEVLYGTQVLDAAGDLSPGEVVTVAGLTLRWRVDAIDIACSNSQGTGAAFARPALFPAELPGSPHVPGP